MTTRRFSDRITLPSSAPSARALPAHELSDRRTELEWLHELAEPHRKKRVDPLPDDMAAIIHRTFDGYFDDEDG